MSDLIAVTGGERVDVGAGERAYVYAGGTVRVTAGGRAFVGSGGAARLLAEGRVSLVEDGLGALLPERGAPAVVATRGDVVAECGRAWVGPRARYRATGSAELWVAPGLVGEVDDGHPVTEHVWSDLDADAAWSQVQPPAAAFASTLALDPGDDPVAWLAPLTDALEALGGTTTVEREHTTVTLTVGVPDPGVLADALRTVATPPTLKLLHRGDEGWSLVGPRVALHVGRGRAARRGGFLSRLRGR